MIPGKVVDVKVSRIDVGFQNIKIIFPVKTVPSWFATCPDENWFGKVWTNWFGFEANCCKFCWVNCPVWGPKLLETVLATASPADPMNSQIIFWKLEKIHFRLQCRKSFVYLTWRHWYWSKLLTCLKTLSTDPMTLGWGPVRPSPSSFNLEEREEMKETSWQLISDTYSEEISVLARLEETIMKRSQVAAMLWLTEDWMVAGDWVLTCTGYCVQHVLM